MSKPLLPHPKPASPERLRFDPIEWRRKGAAAYAERREAELRRRVAEDPGYRVLEPGGPLPDSNPERLKKLREEQFAISSGYRKHTIEQPCAACGSYDPEVGSQPAHVGKTRGAGAKAERVLPLCEPCHRWEESNSGFDEAFYEQHEVWPWDMALYRYEMFHRDKDAS